jgi:hypothetical protein
VKAAKSFMALFIGWLAACTWDYFRQLLSVAGTAQYTLFLSGIHASFTMLGWLLFGLPVAYFTPRRWSSRWYICVFVGFAISLIAYLLLIYSWLGKNALQLPWFPWFPVILGAVGALAYWLLNTNVIDHFLSRSRVAAITGLYLLPWLILFGSVFILWPVFIKVCPYTAYRFGDSESRDRAKYEILIHLEMGDTYSTLHQKYPIIFNQPILGETGEESAGNFKWIYHIKFDDKRSRITEIIVNREP